MPLPTELMKKVGGLKKKIPAWLTGKFLFWGAMTLSGVAILIALSIFDPGETQTTSTKKDRQGKVLEITTTTTPQDAKNIWDWVGLLGVPIALTAFGWFQQSREKQQALADKKIAEQQVLVEKEVAEQKAFVEKGIAEQQAKTEKEIAESNQREEALQNYLDRLSDLLIEKNLIGKAVKFQAASEKQAEDNQPDLKILEEKELLDAASDVIRARTLSLLRRLGKDGERKGHVIRFLIEAEVISKLKLNLGNADLSGADLRDADLSGADLRDADLNGANLRDADLSGADFRDADLSGADLSVANLSGADLSVANLSGADLSVANLSGTNLSGTNLSVANLSGANLSGANLSGADLRCADLSFADLSFATLTKAKSFHAKFVCANLNGANLRLIRFSGADFSGADFIGTNLTEARLVSSDLSVADLTGADLSDARLSYSEFYGANLDGAKLNGAGLNGTKLSGAHKWNEDELGKAILFETELPEGCNLNPNRDFRLYEQ